MENNILFLCKETITQELKQLKDMIYFKEELLKKITAQLQDECEHRIVIDHVDLLAGYRESVKIKYCEVCEKTFD